MPEIDDAKLEKIANTEGRANRLTARAGLTKEERRAYRPLREAKFGVVRDVNGRIKLSKEQLKERIAAQEAKKIDYQKRLKNIDEDIAFCKKQLGE